MEAQTITSPQARRTTSEHHREQRRATGAFVLSWIPYALLVYHFWWICDDAFISFRYARNWALGNGLRYNLGEHVPVEGYSNFLWVAVCTVLEYFNAQMTFWPLLISFACGSLLLYLVFRTLHHRLGLKLRLSLLASLLLACSPSFAVWSTSGLETVPFALLFFVTFDRLILRQDGVSPVSAGLAGLALSLMRVEGICWALALAALALSSRRVSSQRCGRQIAIYLGLLVSGYALYWACRYSYYQLPLPNSAYVKVGIAAPILERGLYYVIVQFLSVLPLFAIIPGVIAGLRQRCVGLGLAVSVIPPAVVLYSVLVGGDFMPMGRFLVPCLAFTAILFGWLLESLTGESPVRHVLIVSGSLILIFTGILASWDIQIVPEALRARFHFRHNTRNYQSEYAQWCFARDNAAEWTQKGLLLSEYAKEGDSIVEEAIGAVGYYSSLFVYDQCGLVTRSVAMRDARRETRRSPGHDKMVRATFFLEEEPTILFAHIRGRRRLNSWFHRAERGSLFSLYVADFMETAVNDKDGYPYYLCLYRRIDKGVKPEAAWERARQRLHEVRSTQGGLPGVFGGSRGVWPAVFASSWGGEGVQLRWHTATGGGGRAKPRKRPPGAAGVPLRTAAD